MRSRESFVKGLSLVVPGSVMFAVAVVIILNGCDYYLENGCPNADPWYDTAEAWLPSNCICDVGGEFYNDQGCVEGRDEFWNSCLDGVGPPREDWAWVCEDYTQDVLKWCWDKPLAFNSDYCAKVREKYPRDDAGAGADAEVDVDADIDGGTDAAMDPDAQGFMPMHCVDPAPDFFAPPESVWFGPAGEVPADCSEELGAFGGKTYYEFEDPGPDWCPLCACGTMKGDCSAAAGSMELRASPCNSDVAPTIDFGPPEDWDGSCSNDHAIGAGTKCPLDTNGENLCVQSMYTPSLPEPEQGCEPVVIPIARITAEPGRFKKGVLSCHSVEYLDLIRKKTCLPLANAAPEKWHSCVRADTVGIHDCPSGGEYTVRFITYRENAIIDTRSCSDCGCKSSGGACRGELHLYEDGACSSPEIASATVTSDGNECFNFDSPGRAVGSKKLSNLAYVPGTCEPTGGLPTGGIELDSTEAVTWCCLAKEPEVTMMPRR